MFLLSVNLDKTQLKNTIILQMSILSRKTRQSSVSGLWGKNGTDLAPVKLFLHRPSLALPKDENRNSLETHNLEGIRKKSTGLNFEIKQCLPPFKKNLLCSNPNQEKENLIRLSSKRTSLQFNTDAGVTTGLNPFYEKLLLNRQLSFQNHGTKVTMEVRVLKQTLNSMSQTIESHKKMNSFLQEKQKHFELFFKEIKLKDLPDQASSSELQKNSQLKILTLERKIEVLSYIVKQYRQDNKNEAREFENRIKDYKPSIQYELSVKLAAANDANQDLRKKVAVIEECFLPQVENFQTISSLLLNYRAQIDKLSKDSDQKTVRMSLVEEENKVLSGSLNKLIEIDSTCLAQKEIILSLQREKSCLQAKYNELSEKFLEVENTNSFLVAQLDALKNIEEKMTLKEETIRKNSQQIMRLQNENAQLQRKISSVMQSFQARLFGETGLKERIILMNGQVGNFRKRLLECLSDMEVYDKEKTHFIDHLFERIRSSYEEIFKEYRDQLSVTSNQCKQWKQAFENYNHNERSRAKFLNQISIELSISDKKTKRCKDLHEGTQYTMECDSCQQYVAQWGQMHSLYEQVRGNIERMRLIFTTSQ